MCRVDLRTMAIVATKCLQPASGAMSKLFIGDYSQTNVDTIAVARNFSGDVVIVDAATFAQLDRVPVPDQPIKATVVSDGAIVTRDWQSGRVAQSRF